MAADTMVHGQGPVGEQEVYFRKYVFLLDQILFNRQIKPERLVANLCICLPFVFCLPTKTLGKQRKYRRHHPMGIVH